MVGGGDPADTAATAAAAAVELVLALRAALARARAALRPFFDLRMVEVMLVMYCTQPPELYYFQEQFGTGVANLY